LQDLYAGFQVLEVSPDLITSLKSEKYIETWKANHRWHVNMYVELKSTKDPKDTVLGRVVEGGGIERVTISEVADVRPKNREQAFALHAVGGDVPVVCLTGPAGTGKSICALAGALAGIDKGKYRKIILTKPMSQVGRYELGALPGDADEKFLPYLLNYTTNIEYFVGRGRVHEFMREYNMEIVPIQLLRGASFSGCYVIADEVQVCNRAEILTIGSRIGEGSKIILMGDLDQRDENIAKEDTGIYHLVNSPIAKRSPLVSCVALERCERSKTSRLFTEVFSGE